MLFARNTRPETVFKLTGQYTDRNGARCVQGTTLDGRWDTAATLDDITLVADVATIARVAYH